MIFDAHVHFWKYNPLRDTWINDEMNGIKKDFLPADYKRLIHTYPIEGCIAVQADPSEEETTFLLKLAEENPFIEGVVGWVDLAGEDSASKLEHFSKNPLLKGIRCILQDKSAAYIRSEAFLNGISQLSKYNLNYDILIYPEQLGAVREVVRNFPAQPFVIDHLAKPHIEKAEMNLWQQEMTQIAQFENVYCKISGLITEADWKNWKKEDFVQYLDLVFSVFGITRIFFGSDWPVCNLAGTYGEVVEIIRDYMRDFSDLERKLVFYENARKFYKI